MSLVLRHKPEVIGLKMDKNGWVEVDELISKSKLKGHHFDRETLEHVVKTNDKKRFSFSDDGHRIRANQGHSLEIELELKPVRPPELLFHGTATRNLDSIFEKGLLKGTRQHVHLTENKTTAKKVGQRYGKPVILVLLSSDMHDKGYDFYLSENNVWLTDHVPPEFLSVDEQV